MESLRELTEAELVAVAGGGIAGAASSTTLADIVAAGDTALRPASLGPIGRFILLEWIISHIPSG
jgi:hypothetical protein